MKPISALAVGLALAGLLVLAHPREATAAVIGVGDQQTRLFGSPAFRSLRIDHVRVVIPWDAALTRDARAQQWIDTALSAGLTPLVALERSRSVSCPGASCRAPSVAEYEAGVAALLRRWPQIRELTPWNEPNHRSQPTYELPGLAAEYYNAARRRCSACRLVAGDLLDDGNLSAWLAAYQRDLDEDPAIWGLHNYYDATYFASQGVDTMLQRVSGQVWLTETGGIVRFSPGGAAGLPYDEARAADSISWLFALTAQRSRVSRMYLYHWQGDPANDFDAGLVGPTGAQRPGLGVVRAHVGTRSASAPAGRPSVAGRRTVVQIGRRALRLVRRGLRIRVACVTAPVACSGRLAVSTHRSVRARQRARVAISFRIKPGHARTRTVRLSRRQRRRLARPKALRTTYCLSGSRRCRTVRRSLSTR